MSQTQPLATAAILPLSGLLRSADIPVGKTLKHRTYPTLPPKPQPTTKPQPKKTGQIRTKMGVPKNWSIPMKELAQIRIDCLSDLISFGCDGSQEKVNLLSELLQRNDILGFMLTLLVIGREVRASQRSIGRFGGAIKIHAAPERWLLFCL